MGAITQGCVGGVFAATEVQRFAGGGLIRHGREICAFVGAVAEWLASGFTASAPEVFFTFFNVYRIRRGLGDCWFRHVRQPLLLFICV